MRVGHPACEVELPVQAVEIPFAVMAVVEHLECDRTLRFGHWMRAVDGGEAALPEYAVDDVIAETRRVP
ncbi:hypothetical protein GCM10023114_33100 [Mycolicibacterium sediminis]|uniref:Uncharacterized protein n=1 Tax=Mycolicibacterium sediminis TaxID=1286180 RepID=A0A7I7QZ76_9MYCO|nr:hypothetical protein MSEDJ_57340 [Mycolicibacterium sediminis]